MHCNINKHIDKYVRRKVGMSISMQLGRKVNKNNTIWRTTRLFIKAIIYYPMTYYLSQSYNNSKQ